MQTNFQTPSDFSVTVWPAAGLFTILTPGSTFLNPASVNLELITVPPGRCRLMEPYWPDLCFSAHNPYPPPLLPPLHVDLGGTCLCCRVFYRCKHTKKQKQERHRSILLCYRIFQELNAPEIEQLKFTGNTIAI